MFYACLCCRNLFSELVFLLIVEETLLQAIKMLQTFLCRQRAQSGYIYDQDDSLKKLVQKTVTMRNAEMRSLGQI